MSGTREQKRHTRTSRIAATWRRQRYVVEGDHLVPATAADAEEYDPFDHYAGVSDIPLGETPYLDLASLDLNDTEAIEQFASAWGLLGLFQHNLVQLRYVPTRDGRMQLRHDPPLYIDEPSSTATTERISGFLGAGSDFDDDLVPFAHEWFSGQSLDFQDGSRVRHSWDDLDTDDEREYVLDEVRAVERQRWLDDPAKRGEALYVDPHGEVQRASLDDYARPFFPNATVNPRTYPSIDSATLWGELHEPLEAFRSAAREFQRQVHFVADADEWSDDLARAIERNLRSVHPRIEFHADEEGGRWVERWHFPSLLAACYTMLHLDLTKQRAVRICASDKCDNAFIAERSDRMYCTPRCKNAHKMRLKRAKDRQQEARR